MLTPASTAHPWRLGTSPWLGRETGAVIERKAADLLACLGRERERFERELMRSRYLGRFAVVVEAGLPDLLTLAAADLSAASIVGSLAA